MSICKICCRYWDCPKGKIYVEVVKCKFYYPKELANTYLTKGTTRKFKSTENGREHTVIFGGYNLAEEVFEPEYNVDFINEIDEIMKEKSIRVGNKEELFDKKVESTNPPITNDMKLNVPTNSKNEEYFKNLEEQVRKSYIEDIMEIYEKSIEDTINLISCPVCQSKELKLNTLHEKHDGIMDNVLEKEVLGFTLECSDCGIQFVIGSTDFIQNLPMMVDNYGDEV